MEGSGVSGEEIFSLVGLEPKNRRSCHDNEGFRDEEGDGRDAKGEKELVSWCEDGSDDDDKRVELGLVGKVWTKWVINPNAFISTMKGIWRVQFGVDISNIGKNLFQFQFYHWKDKEKILKAQP